MFINHLYSLVSYVHLSSFSPGMVEKNLWSVYSLYQTHLCLPAQNKSLLRISWGSRPASSGIWALRRDKWGDADGGPPAAHQHLPTYPCEVPIYQIYNYLVA